MKKLTTLGLFTATGLAFLLAPDAAFAQPWGRGFGVSVGNGGVYVGSTPYYYDSYYGSPYYGYSRGWWGSPYYSSGYYWGSSPYYYSRPYYYSYSTPYYYDTYSSFYSSPAQYQYRSMYPSDPSNLNAADNRVTLNIQTPPGANLWINDVFMGRSDGTRQITSPPLQAGRRFVYAVKARWMQDGREMMATRSQEFQAGSQRDLSFDLMQGQPVAEGQGTRTDERGQIRTDDRNRGYQSQYPQNQNVPQPDRNLQPNQIEQVPATPSPDSNRTSNPPYPK